MRIFSVGVGVTCASVALLSSILWDGRKSLPIMDCDPVTLQKGMSEADIIAGCGKPNDVDRKLAAWYPLRGGTRESAKRGDVVLIYGSIRDKEHNVNLYLENDQLNSVQIYGDYK